ncbi:alpha-xenorhabdolysin family binary toxin subunit A [Pseudomonas sp. UMAB-08]|uniref:alpha-xenorhabdolysin family binary toxin subunit A n=1 Tax=Pseudomonas sp. UMAB-08 TaxID=1365375 RepID=UPI001C593848|nr:alpha-xenorhabdolysin family binary toxin subunit A [Pseudomonas sp. UMAB-08]
MLNSSTAEVSAEDVGLASERFMALASSSHPEVIRSPGLLVTNEDVRRIKRYVESGLELPAELAQVQQLLGYEKIDIPGLEPSDMQVIYQGIKKHAESWSTIETGMKTVGASLIVFSEDLESSGGAITAFVKGLEGYKSATGMVGDLTPEEINKLPEVSLGEGDKKKMPTLLALVSDLRTALQHHSKTTSDVNVKISDFKDILKDVIAPAVGLKIALCASNGNDKEIARLTAEVDIINTQIAEKLATYESYSTYKWLGAWWGPIGLAISASIYGAKAAATLTEKDQLITQKQALEQQISARNGLLSSLIGFETSLQDLKIRIEGASGSASNLESMWGLVQGYIDSSYRKLEGITDATYLVIFVTRLESIISSWVSIRKQAQDLLTAFNNVTAER